VKENVNHINVVMIKPIKEAHPSLESNIVKKQKVMVINQ
jgi:hypothetical protein